MKRSKKLKMISDYTDRLRNMHISLKSKSLKAKDFKYLDKDFDSCYTDVEDYQLALIKTWGLHRYERELEDKHNQTNKGEIK